MGLFRIKQKLQSWDEVTLWRNLGEGLADLKAARGSWQKGSCKRARAWGNQSFLWREDQNIQLTFCIKLIEQRGCLKF